MRKELCPVSQKVGGTTELDAAGETAVSVWRYIRKTEVEFWYLGAFVA
jgi:hypothetical protein